jgi:hypothetical protein
MAYWCYERESLQRLISSFFDKKRAEGSNLKETKHVAMMGLAQAGTENKSRPNTTLHKVYILSKDRRFASSLLLQKLTKNIWNY